MIKNRIELAKHFASLGLKTGAEVGVFAGHYSEILCKTIPGLKLYCIDGWAAYEGYRDRQGEAFFREAYDQAIVRLAPYDTEIVRKFSMDAVRDFEDESLDFVYIDGNHGYEYVKQDIEAWSKKVRPGGIVAGDDYYVMRTGNAGVIQAVDEYAKKHGVDMNITPEDKVTIIDHDDRQSQWWFRKE